MKQSFKDNLIETDLTLDKRLKHIFFKFHFLSNAQSESKFDLCTIV